jgi:pimeloyl-ACP methyl ester carboxylesterase
VLLLVILVLLLLVAPAVISGYVAWQLTHPARDYATQTPASAGLLYRDVQFRSREGQVSLTGWFLPAGTSTATVIMVPGYAHHRLFDAGSLLVARALVLHGFNVLTFDPRATGRSGGSMVTVGDNEQYDVLGAVDYLKRRFAGRLLRIGVLGYSANGTASLLAGSKDPADIRAIVTDSAIAALYPYILDHADTWTHLPAFPMNQLIAWETPLLTGLDPHDVSAVAAVRQMPHTAIFFIAGTADTIVPDGNTLTLYDAATTRHKQLWLVPNGGHAASYLQQPRAYEQKVVAFFQRYLGG